MNIAEQQDAVCIFIGQRIRERRKLLKLSQNELAEFMGFSYQQMQKYEKGLSHVSAGKLLLFAKILNVPPSYFYDGIRLEECIGKRIETNIIQKTRTRALRILLVEDNPADVILFEKALSIRAEQTDVHVIHDVEKTLDFINNHDAKFDRQLPDIIIVDLSMPKLGGLDLLKSLKKNPKTMEIPVLILTNSINTTDMMAAYKYGAAGFIQKSVDLEEYIEAMGIVVKYWSKVVALPRS